MMELTLEIDDRELFDEAKCEFISIKKTSLKIEHSLYTISLWESKWHKPWVSDKEKTLEEEASYFQCMCYQTPVEPFVYLGLNNYEHNMVRNYISNPMSASTVAQTKTAKHSGEIVTSELIYYWMTAYQIPFECQHWHLNRLMMLIQIANAKNASDSSMNKREIMSQNRALNAARRKAARRR